MAIELVNECGGGTSGLIGSTGLPGPTGLQGMTGPQGKGETGLDGVTGQPGPTGLGVQGETGLRGIRGETGLLGQTGYPGVTGPAGKGETGLTGVTGLVGPTGVRGIQGIQGDTGLRGPTGYGIAGRTGVQGIQGSQGDTGLDGVKGDTGAEGAQGHTGALGPKGNPGVTGPQGIRGVAGSQGETGFQGIQGNRGATGIRGIQGDTGAQGLKGDKGATGVDGVEGQTGIQGIQGPTGARGQRGFTGVEGAQGTTGIKGIQGVQGQTGAEGKVGETGIRGLQGDTGAEGQMGLTGVTGLIGSTGVQGIQGQTGAEGQTGLTGATGINGIQGETGITGATGAGIQGETGFSGPTGLGVQGETGLRGLRGETGLLGATGYPGVTGPAGGGENNTASNVGAANEVFKQKSGIDLQFRTLIAGSNVNIVQNADTIEISSTASGSGTGDVTGDTSSVDNSIVRFDGVTGKAIQGYVSDAPTITDDGVIQAKNDVKITTNNVDRLKVDDDGLTSYIDNNTPLASALGVSEVKYYTNEATNTLNFKLKYADGTVKRAVLPLLSGADWASAVAYQLNDVDSYFTSETPAFNFGISGATEFTMTMTLNFDMTLTDQAYLLSFFAGTATGKVELFWINSTFRFFVNDAYTSAQPTRANKDYHLVFVFDGSQVGNLDRAKIYVDGVLETNGSSGTIPAVVNTEITKSKLSVMNRYTPTTAWFPGRIKEMSFYNRALTQIEVTNLYNSGSYSDPTLISGCTGSWWFGDNLSDDENIVVDNVGSANLTPINIGPGDII